MKAAAWQPFCTSESVEYGVAGDAVTLHHRAQVLERLELDLPHPLAGHPDLFADTLERLTTVAVQPEPALDDLALLVDFAKSCVSVLSGKIGEG